MHSPNIPLVVSSFKLSSVYTSSWFLYGENEFNLILLQIDIQFCWISHLSVTEFFWHFWRLCSGPLVSGQHQTACHCSSEVQSEQKHCCMSSCVLSSYNFFACSGLFGFSGLVKEDVRTPRAITLYMHFLWLMGPCSQDQVYQSMECHPRGSLMSLFSALKYSWSRLSSLWLDLLTDFVVSTIMRCSP